MLENVDAERIKMAEEAARLIIQACGRKLDEKSLVNTPERFAKFLVEEFPGEWNIEDFVNGDVEEDFDELILETDIPFTALCEHHLLPFYGKAHVAYLPHGKRLSGLSKIARVVSHYAGTITVQERLTKQIADFLNDKLDPKGVFVVLEAYHMCMISRGAKAIGAKTFTSCVKGVFLSNPAARTEAQMLMLRSG
ncbi:hypothetical protein LCGC14_0918850 [marine sediment metagenome]|uniref:GTP cyclohydrolase I n=1 Tax=marine sediment metagenome TaxID=412755 RepID=A0A0F9NW72_9ZZZZ